MKHPLPTPLEGLVARPVYFVSNRPEAYEISCEINRDAAIALARLIAERAGHKFPGIDFRVDGNWHTHDPALDHVAAYIESHWPGWASKAGIFRKSA